MAFSETPYLFNRPGESPYAKIGKRQQDYRAQLMQRELDQEELGQRKQNSRGKFIQNQLEEMQADEYKKSIPLYEKERQIAEARRQMELDDLNAEMYGNQQYAPQQQEQQYSQQYGQEQEYGQEGQPQQAPGQYPQQQQMPQQQQGFGGSINPEYERLARREKLAGRDTNFKTQVDADGNVWANIRGQMVQTGIKELSDEQKVERKTNAENNKKVEQQMTAIITSTDSVMHTLDAMDKLLDNPKLQKVLSATANSTGRSISNAMIRSFADEESMALLKEYEALSNKLVLDTASSKGGFGGNVSNMQTRIISGSKPNIGLSTKENKAVIAQLRDAGNSEIEKAKATNYYISQGVPASEAVVMAQEYYKSKDKGDSSPEAKMAKEEGAKNKKGEKSQSKKNRWMLEALTGGDTVSDLVLGAADSFGTALDSTVNIVPEAIQYATGVDLGRVKHTDLRDKEATGIASLAQSAGGLAGTLGAGYLGTQFLPNAGNAVTNQLGKGFGRDILAATADGAVKGGLLNTVLNGQDNRAGSAAIGAAIGGAAGGLSSTLSKVYEYLNPTETAKKVVNDFVEKQSKYGQQMNNAILEGEKQGIYIKGAQNTYGPDSKILKIDGHKNPAEFFKTGGQPDVAQAIEAFERNPTLGNAASLRSIISNAQGNLKSGKDSKVPGSMYSKVSKGLSSAYGAVEKKMEEAFKSAKMPELWNMFKNGSDGYKEKVVPYLNNKYVQDFIDIYRKAGGQVSSAETKQLISNLAKDKTFLREIGEVGHPISDAELMAKVGNNLFSIISTALLSTGIAGYGLSKMISPKIDQVSELMRAYPQA